MVLALGFAVLFQFIILRLKFNKGMYADVGVDIGMLVILNSIFGGSILGVISATAGSTLISLYLLWQPIKLLQPNVEDETYEESDLDRALAKMHDRIDELVDQTYKGKK